MAVLCAFSLSACVGKSSSDSSSGASATLDASCEKKADLVLKGNSIQGGKSSANAEWIESWLVPNFEKYEKDKGNAVTLKFEGDGSDDEAYKTKVSLDLKTGGGADVVSIDGIWVGDSPRPATSSRWRTPSVPRRSTPGTAGSRSPSRSKES